MEPVFLWSVSAVALALVAGGSMIAYGLRRRDRTPSSLEEVDGILKKDWTRTGRIDFRVTELDSASPQHLIFRVEEQKIVENSMGDDVVQLRWRLGTIEEAKELVVCWNQHNLPSVSPAEAAMRTPASS
jgi:hypothetical protein